MNHSRSNAGATHEPDLPPYQVVLAETDWDSLQTAFGNGEDLRRVLARLLEPDPKVQVTALSELGELVGHQNTIYEATAPVAMYVAGILTHPAAMTLRPYRNVLAEHPALAEHRDHLAVHARRILDASSDDPNRRIALEAWGHDVPNPEPFREKPWDWGPHSDGRGDLEPPF
ncbi:hypothetical protein AB0I54_31085 [Streptomyces sp. NPDC050625]|uniref:hypothetical protein n=1 Tax=Streptomyces sp. NPDC050625 TaxID=3154629 RepID=UPI00342D036E